MGSETEPNKGAGGRPSTYSADIAGRICDRLSAGETLREICRDDAIPAQSTVYLWLRTQAEFSEQYARAREVQADTWADEIVEIADNGSNDWVARNHGEDDDGWRVNGEHIQRSRLRVDARKWLMAKAAPKKYGDKIENVHTGPDGGNLKIESIRRVIVDPSQE